MATITYHAGRLDAVLFEDPLLRPFTVEAASRSDTHFFINGFPSVEAYGSGFTYIQSQPAGGMVNRVEVVGFNVQDYSIHPPYLTELYVHAPYITISGLDASLSFLWGGSSYELGGIRYAGLEAAVLRWLQGDDDVIGTSGNDLLRGYEGANRYYVNGGRDVVDGQHGFDTIVLDGSRSKYTFSHETASINALTQPAIGVTNDTDSVLGVDVERFEFSDLNVAFDLQEQGSAGWAARLIGVLVGKEAIADNALAGELISYVDTHGIQTVTELLVSLGVTADLAGGSDNASLFTLLYTNVVGTEPSAAELDELVGYVDSGAYTQAQALEAIAGLDLTAIQIGLTGLAQTGWEYIEYGA